MVDPKRQLVETLQIIEQFGNADPRLRLVLNNLEVLHYLQDDRTSALQVSRRLMQICEQALGPNHVDSATAANNLGVLESSDSLVRRALDTWRQELGSDHQDIVVGLNNLTAIAYAKRNLTEAEAFANEAYALGIKISKYHPDVATATNNLAVIYQALGREREAETFYKNSRTLWERTLSPDHENIAISLGNLGSLYRKQEHHAEAERLLQISSDIARKSPQSLFDELGSFFLMTSPYPETGLLRMRPLREKPLRADFINDRGLLNEYSAFVAALREEPRERLLHALERLGPWYHNIELQPGVSTNPPMGDHPANRWRILEPFVPADLSGKTVLDIGCNAGFFSVQMKQRGADRVLGIDIMPHVLAQARFVSTWFNQPIELREMDTYGIEALGQFDFVIFVGVLYHLKHPLYALEKMAAVCKDTMYFQSVIRGPLEDFNPDDDYSVQERDIFDIPAYPKLYFIEKSFNGDVSNWWFATRSCLRAMLRTVGFREVLDTDSPDTFICRK